MAPFTFSQLIILAIFGLAGILHGLTGIGITLVATAALTVLYPLSHVLVLAVLPCLFINVVVFLQGGKPLFYLKKYGLLALMSFLGSLIGAKLIFVLPQSILLVSVGLLILSYVLSQGLTRTLILPATMPAMVISGLVAGILGGATNAMSPVLMVYLLASTVEGPDNKTHIVVASNLCYMVGKIAQLIVLWPSIVSLAAPERWLIAIATIVAVLALLVGFYFRNKLPSTVFRKIILLVLFVLSIILIFKGINHSLAPEFTPH